MTRCFNTQPPSVNPPPRRDRRSSSFVMPTMCTRWRWPARTKTPRSSGLPRMAAFSAQNTTRGTRQTGPTPRVMRPAISTAFPCGASRMRLSSRSIASIDRIKTWPPGRRRQSRFEACCASVQGGQVLISPFGKLDLEALHRTLVCFQPLLGSRKRRDGTRGVRR